MPISRAILYIDGFNFYYGAIKDTPYKWLNIELFAKQLRNADNVLKVRYFTSIMNGPSGQRQSRYLEALATLPLLTTELGSFKNKQIRCRHSGCSYTGRRDFLAVEEKRTDVTIALRMVEDAMMNACDRLVLISGDSDLVPAVKLVRSRFAKPVTVYVPSKKGAEREAERRADELRSVASNFKVVPARVLAVSLFADSFTSNGRTHTKPEGW